MVVRMLAGDLRDGLIRVRNIPVTGASASVKVGAAGAISADLKFPLVDPYTQLPIPFLEQISPAKSFLAYDENGKIVNAGPIWNDVADLDANTLTLNATGLRSVWDYRFVLPALIDADPTSLPPGKDTSLTGLSYPTIAKRLVQQAQAWTSGSFPIVFESDVLGDFVRNYAGEDLKNLGEALDQLSGVIGGPDIAFRPRYTTDGNHIEWVMMTGTPLAQPGSPHLFDMSVPNAAVRGAKRTRDGSAIVTDDYQTGTVPEDQPDATALIAKAVDTLLTRPAQIINTCTDPFGLGNTTTYLGTAGGGGAVVSTATVAAPGASRAARSTCTTAGTYLDVRPRPVTVPLTPGTTNVAAKFWMQSSKASPVNLVLAFYADTTGTTPVGTNLTVAPPNIAANTWTLESISGPVPPGAVSYTVVARTTAAAAVGDTVDMALLTTLENETVVDEVFTGESVDNADHEYAWQGSQFFSPSARWNTGGYPRMEASTDRSSVSELQTLQDYADAAVKVGEKMTETWSFNARKTSPPTLNEYSEGDFAKLRTKSAILGKGDHDLRIMEISVKMGDQFAAITCAPVRE